MEGLRFLLLKHRQGVWMMNPSLIIIICLEVLLFLLLSSQDISSRDTYGLSDCLFFAFFLISVFAEWVIVSG